MSETEPDVIDLLAGIPKGSRLDGVRAGAKTGAGQCPEKL